MATDAPSWADQWGAGGIGAMEEEDNSKTQKDGGSSKKANEKAGFSKAKAAAVMGAQKIKSGASNGFKWVKSLSQKKNSST